MKPLSRHWLGGLFSVLLGLLIQQRSAHADEILVTNNAGTVGAYTTSGATVNASLISGLNLPHWVAVSGSDVFVTSEGSGTLGEYTTSGGTVNASLITGLNVPVGIGVSGSDLFVANNAGNTISEYTTSGSLL